MNTTILKSLKYPLLATTLTVEECHKIISPALIAAIPRSKVQHFLPRQLVHAPLSHQGLPIHFLFNTQLTLGGINSITGQLLQRSGENLVIELEIHSPIWTSCPKPYVELATRGWMKQTWWESMYTSPLHLLDTIPTIRLQQQSDSYIMDVLVDSGATEKELGLLSQCRLFLQVTTVADIATADGKHLKIRSWNGLPKLSCQSSSVGPASLPHAAKLGRSGNVASLRLSCANQTMVISSFAAP
jgi:hypothetical protein